MDQGGAYKDCGLSDGSGPCRGDDYVTFDLTAQIPVTDKFTFYTTVLNVFDDLPPLDPVTYGAHLYNPVQGADIVINLVGILKGDFHKIHVEGAANVAKEAVAAGANGLIHVSAIGADPQSPSAYGRSTGEGDRKSVV